MRILAFDASVEPGSCALLADGTLREQAVAAGTSSSQGLLPIAAALLDAAGLHWSELDAIAFGSGPGGFTGLRVACGIAQGLAFAHATPVVPVDSLAALAAVALAEHPQCDAVLALLDARMGEVYCAQYRRAAGAPARLGEAAVLERKVDIHAAAMRQRKHRARCVRARVEVADAVRADAQALDLYVRAGASKVRVEFHAV